MKNAYKLLAVVAVSALLTVSTSGYATTTHHKATHHHHHKMATTCKKDKHGDCMHLFSAMGRGDDAWKGTRKAWQNVRAD